MNSTITQEIDAQVHPASFEDAPPAALRRQGPMRHATPAPGPSGKRTPSQRRTINTLLTFFLLGSIFLDYWQYSRDFHATPSIYLDVIAGTADAPAQYRIGVVDTVHFLVVHTHLPMRAGFTLVDLGSAFTACFILLLVLRRSRAYVSAGDTGQWLAEVAFIALVQFYLAWLIWYQRPETLPTAALLALGLLFLTVPLGSKPLQTILAGGGILSVTAAQSFVRADVAFAFNVGILIVCLSRKRPSFVLGRNVQASVSIASVGTAVAIQLYLMRVVFPHANYGNTPVVQLFRNLKVGTGCIPFLVVMLPIVWAIWRVVAKKSEISGPEAAMLMAACTFVCMWVVVGVAAEVRIFLPYGLILTPLLSTLFLQMVVPAEEPARS